MTASMPNPSDRGAELARDWRVSVDESFETLIDVLVAGLLARKA